MSESKETADWHDEFEETARRMFRLVSQRETVWLETKQENDSLVSICNSKEVQLKAIGYQLEKGIKAVEQFLADGSLPYTEGFWKLAKPLEEFVASAKEELRLWEGSKR